jgi:trehalose 6-phosphate phosphatase
MLSIVDRLTALYPTSIVTGRRLETIQNFIHLPSLYYAASHGFDIRGPENHYFYQVATEFLPELQRIRDLLQSILVDYPGAALEDNHFSLSLHYRHLHSDSARNSLLSEIDKLLLCSEYSHLIRLHGKMLWEIRPNIRWHKGAAIKWLIDKQSENTASIEQLVPVFLGDDLTDEDGFRELQAYPNSITIFVTAGMHRETNARYTLNNCKEVESFLKEIATAESPPLSSSSAAAVQTLDSSPSPSSSL